MCPQINHHRHHRGGKNKRSGGGNAGSKKDTLPPKPSPYRVVPCRFYKEDLCTRGENCTFRHDPDMPNPYINEHITTRKKGGIRFKYQQPRPLKVAAPTVKPFTTTEAETVHVSELKLGPQPQLPKASPLFGMIGDVLANVYKPQQEDQPLEPFPITTPIIDIKSLLSTATDGLCVICCDRLADQIIVPCLHQCLCKLCATTQMTITVMRVEEPSVKNRCPLCQTHILRMGEMTHS